MNKNVHEIHLHEKASATDLDLNDLNQRNQHKLLKQQIKNWAQELGFADLGFSHTDLTKYESGYFNWIDQGFHGEMEYMVRHGTKRTRPQELEPKTLSVISARMNYLDFAADNPIKILKQSNKAYISRYALGKDYHKLLRKRLQKLAEKIQAVVPEFQYRAFTDSAPVLERPIAEQAGLGFIGKNSLLIHPRAGSWFFLGELYCNINFEPDPPFTKQGCGPCTACMQECPTNAIIADGVVDARKCISYLTIEHKGSIPHEFRQAMGNRIYGCDDCQLVCPWNRFTDDTQETAFQSSQELDSPELLTLWNWTEDEFLKRMQGSPIRRIGYEQWLRNLVIGIGNIKGSTELMTSALHALETKLKQTEMSEMLVEHIEWAITELKQRLSESHTVRDKDNNLSSKNSVENNAQNLKPFKAKKYYLPKDIKD